MRRKETQQTTQRVRVLVPVSITGVGTLDAGEHELDPTLAELLIERGFAQRVENGKEVE